MTSFYFSVGKKFLILPVISITTNRHKVKMGKCHNDKFTIYSRYYVGTEEDYFKIILQKKKYHIIHDDTGIRKY